ncbi:hypothetical protein [Micromonospora sp. NPDC005806]|uniref:hypothetical protein n=1 Tax=Micromonospora sp. NPDC005806 TaxID=3364234 RepID=UPI0036B8121C
MIAGFLATLLLAGCGLVARPRPGAPLRFEFAATTGDGYMNQLLTIYNGSTKCLPRHWSSRRSTPPEARYRR